MKSVTALNAYQHHSDAWSLKLCSRIFHAAAEGDANSGHMLATGPSLVGHLEGLCPRGHFQHHTLQTANLGTWAFPANSQALVGGVRQQAHRPPLCRGQVIRTLPGSYHRDWHRTSFHLQSRPFSQYLRVKNSLRPGWPGLFLSGKLGVRNNIVSRKGD